MSSDYLMTEAVSAEYGWPIETLRTWRKQGRGPRSGRVGRRVLYKRADVEAWIEEQISADPLSRPVA